jgi:mono/diheme cytochrome c family protein
VTRPCSLLSATLRWRALLCCLLAGAGACRADDASIGRDIFQENCAVCHGKNMVSPGTLAFDLRKFPPAEAERFRRSVREGTPKGMPAWKSQLSAEDIEALWDYVKSGG